MVKQMGCNGLWRLLNAKQSQSFGIFVGSDRPVPKKHIPYLPTSQACFILSRSDRPLQTRHHLLDYIVTFLVGCPSLEKGTLQYGTLEFLCQKPSWATNCSVKIIQNQNRVQCVRSTDLFFSTRIIVTCRVEEKPGFWTWLPLSQTECDLKPADIFLP